MEKSFVRLDKLQILINIEKGKYKNAIVTNQRFETIKLIFLKITELQTEADILMQQANQLYLRNLNA